MINPAIDKMKKINANLLFYIYFISITYAFAMDISIANNISDAISSQFIVASMVGLLKSNGLDPRYIATYLGALLAVYISNIIASLANEDEGNSSTLWRISPLIAFHLWISSSYFAHVGVTEISRIYLMIIFVIAIIPAFALTAIIAKKEVVYSINEYPRDTIIGIKVYHFYWLIFPVYYYGVQIINESINIFGMFLHPHGIFNFFFLLISGISPLAYYFPMFFVFKILSGELLSQRSRLIVFFANGLLIILGFFIASVIAKGIDWIKEYFKFLYS